MANQPDFVVHDARYGTTKPSWLPTLCAAAGSSSATKALRRLLNWSLRTADGGWWSQG